VRGPDEDVFFAAYTRNDEWLTDILAGEDAAELARLREAVERLDAAIDREQTRQSMAAPEQVEAVVIDWAHERSSRRRRGPRGSV
jgi:hypothetical protein